MSSVKRHESPNFISNPFIKKRNLEWTIQVPPGTSPAHMPALREDQSPSTNGVDESDDSGGEERAPQKENENSKANLKLPLWSSAAIEAGRLTITDHASHFASLLARSQLSTFPQTTPRFSVDSYRALYESSRGNPRGAHFVIHQHDHPVAGPHYDLRLQINGTSSASWAIMYGLPGDPNSARLNRNATETRVHCLWNHLIETGSSTSGSLLIWDTGTYAVLDRKSKYDPPGDPSSPTAAPSPQPSPSRGDSSDRFAENHGNDDAPTEQQKLHAAFQTRKIKLRLDGARLPRPYVLNLRLTKTEDAQGRVKARRSAENAPRKRKRSGGSGRRGGKRDLVETSSEGDEDEEEEEAGLSGDARPDDGPTKDDQYQAAITATMTGNEGTPPVLPRVQRSAKVLDDQMRREIEEVEDAQIRATNAYPGADNTIGSVHQRKWYLSLDRPACGFARSSRDGARGRERPHWVPKDGDQSREYVEGDDNGGGGDKLDSNRLAYPFYVRGPQLERSVVTGRLGSDILRDEGVESFRGRMGWKPVLN